MAILMPSWQLQVSFLSLTSTVLPICQKFVTRVAECCTMMTITYFFSYSIEYGAPTPKSDSVSMREGKAESAITAISAQLAPHRRQRIIFLAKMWVPYVFSPHFQLPVQSWFGFLAGRNWVAFQVSHSNKMISNRVAWTMGILWQVSIECWICETFNSTYFLPQLPPIDHSLRLRHRSFKEKGIRYHYLSLQTDQKTFWWTSMEEPRESRFKLWDPKEAGVKAEFNATRCHYTI